MSLDFSDVIIMHQNNMIPRCILIAYVMKEIALNGDSTDFNALPAWLRKGIRKRILLFRKTGMWQIISNNGIQYYEESAVQFDEKILQNSRLS